jgi:hypothetical protein
MRFSAAVLVTVLFASCPSAGEVKTDAFNAAENAAANNDFRQARDLYAQAAKSEPDARTRDRATITLANLQWRVFHEPAAARATLAGVDKSSTEYAASLLERSRIEIELAHDFPAARTFARQALEAATRRGEKKRAVILGAAAVIEPLMRDRIAGRCTSSGELTAAQSELQGVIDRDGPFVAGSQWLLDAALLAGDGPIALQAWRWYYGATAGATIPNKLIAPAQTLAAALPAWRGAPASTDERRAVGLALADSRFFREAALVLADPCAKEPLPKDETSAGAIAYAGATQRIHDIAEEYYRTVAAGGGDKRAFEKAVDKERMPALAERYGFNGYTGTTNGVFDMHYGHVIGDEEIHVEQYGRSAALRFVSVDGLVSNGFLMWARDGRGGDGGRSADGAIYQFRRMYADGPVAEWINATDPAVRAERDRDIEEETRRDAVRAKADPLSPFQGLDMRLERQYDDALLQSLKARGLTGDALRDAFIARVRDDSFAASITAHEGRHAIDKKYEHFLSSEELEFRAKLSEVALSSAPRRAISSGILSSILATSPHGRANRRVYKGLDDWMRQHAGEIAGLDRTAPILPQLDKLTDDQLRAAMRSMDPHAK